MSDDDPRRRARMIALQAAYALGYDLIGDLGAKVRAHLQSGVYDEDVVDNHSKQVLDTIVDAFGERREEAIELLEEHMTRPLDSIAPLERTVLVLGVLELLANVGAPRAVVISEWLELTKKYGSANGHQLVNAILDRIQLPQG